MRTLWCAVFAILSSLAALALQSQQSPGAVSIDPSRSFTYVLITGGRGVALLDLDVSEPVIFDPVVGLSLPTGIKIGSSSFGGTRETRTIVSGRNIRVQQPGHVIVSIVLEARAATSVGRNTGEIELAYALMKGAVPSAKRTLQVPLQIDVSSLDSRKPLTAGSVLLAPLRMLDGIVRVIIRCPFEGKCGS